MSEQIQILIDGNAVGYTSHHGQKEILNAKGMQVQAVAGFCYTIRDVKEYVPNANIIVLWDGKSWRNDVLATYKESRDPDLAELEPGSPKYQAAVKKTSDRAAYKAQTPYIHRALVHLGIPQITCFNYEADDLAALFSDRYHAKDMPVRMVTTDGDWMQLIRPRVVWKSNRAPFTMISTKNFTERTGYATPALFVEGKMLFGDAGDCVPGIPGFGEKTVERFFQVFPEGLGQFFDADHVYVERKWMGKVGKKPPRCVMDLHAQGPNHPDLVRNRILVDLRTKFRPPHGEIKTERGAFDDKAFLDLCKELDLYSLVGNLPRFMKTFTGEMI